jgi:hypothetical protein
VLLTYADKHTEIKNKQQRQTRHMIDYMQPVSNERKRGARPSEARQAFDGVPQNKGSGV